MEWFTALKTSVAYMEEHLLEDISAEDVAKEVFMSPFYLQKGFQIMTGFTISEYLRNRRLYLAAVDLFHTNMKIIDIAYKYGYETPESFTRAFTRFHGASPSQMRAKQGDPVVFLPLKLTIEISGGFKVDQMNCVVEKEKAFTIIGFAREFTYEECYEKIPLFWDEMTERHCSNIMQGKPAASPQEQAVVDNGIGMYGFCLDGEKSGKALYVIAGMYKGGDVPEGMMTYEIPEMEWAKFTCYGPIPTSLQTLNTKVFREWLPGNPDYEMCQGYNVEWYTRGNNQSADYACGIWLPVKRKEN